MLQPSLPQDILLNLGLTERPAMVSRTLDLYVQRPELADQVQTPTTRLIDAFDRLDRALLIVGAPGAGKTTLLLTLARDLLQRAAQDREQPIPVYFPLSSWAKRRRLLADWLVDALNEQYDVPRKTGQTWVDADHILPLLDGLDEVQREQRSACVEAINAFRQEHGLLPLVVCSRVADYDALGLRLRLQGALVVQPLTPQQVDNYLTQVGAPLAAVREALQEDATLGELLDTPLMLAIVSLAYAGESVTALRTRTTPAEQRQSLFAAYVDRMFQRRSPMTSYIRPQTERWLTWLAWQLTQHNQTVFYLERMQPTWLPRGQGWVPTQGVRLVAGLLGLLFAGLGGGLVFGLLVGLGGAVIGGLTGYSPEITSIEMVRWSGSRFLSELLLPSGRRLAVGLCGRLVFGLVFGLGGGLVFGLLSGLLFGLGAGLVAGLGAGLVFGLGGGLLVELVFGLGARLLAGLIFGLLFGGLGGGLGVILVAGLGGGLVFGLLFGLGAGLGDRLLVGLGIGLGSGLVYKLYAGLTAGLSGEEITMKATPNEGIRRSARMALASGLGAGLATGIRYGGRTCLQHLVLRLGLRYNGFAPWRYVDFLDYAAERIFLRKVGGGYIFIHRRLQDYFAIRQTEQDGTTPQKVLEQEPQATLSGDADERSWWAILTNHLWAMGMAVGLAGLLWVALAGQQDSEIAMTIPVEYQQIAPNHELRGEVPRKANVRLRGSQLALAATRLRPVRIRVSLAQVRAGIHYFLLTQNQIDLPAGVEITEIRPALLLLEVQIRQTDQDGTTPQKVLEQEPQATPSGDADERSWWAILTDNPWAKGEIAMTIPVEYQQVAPNIDLRGEVPDEVHVHLRGSQLALAATRLWPVRARVSLAQAREGLNYYLLDKNHIALPPGVEITEIRPASLLIEVQEKETFPHSKQ